MTELKVVELETSTEKRKQEVKESIIRLLQTNIEMAESGELTGVVVLGTTADESTHSAWSKQTDNHMMLAALVRALVRMANN